MMNRASFVFLPTLALATACAVAACSTFTTDPAAPEPDASLSPSPDAGDDSSDDARVDRNIDANADAAPPIPPCPVGTFCDGFERVGGAGVEGPWDKSLPASGSAALQLDTTLSRSGSASLKASGQSGGAALGHTLSSSAKLVLDFYLRVESRPEVAANVARFDFANDAGPLTSVAVTLEPNGIKITEQLLVSDPGGNNYRSGAPFKVANGTWIHCVFRINRGTSLTASLTVEGTLLPLTLFNAIGEPRTAWIGLPFVSGQGAPFTAHFDDVTIP